MTANQMQCLSPKTFAEILLRIQCTREESWDAESGCYTITKDAAMHMHVPENWLAIFDCLLSEGYSEMWEWAEEHASDET